MIGIVRTTILTLSFFVLAACSGIQDNQSIGSIGRQVHSAQLKTPSDPPVGVVYQTEYPMPEPFDPNEFLSGIRMGSDQDIWASVYDSNQIARFDSHGLVSAWSFPQDPNCIVPPTCSAGPTDMVAGPDGNMYVSLAQYNGIAQVTPLGAITVYPLDPNVFPILPQGEGPRGIAIGPDGNIWFEHTNSSKIGRMTLSGQVINAYNTPTPNGGGGRIAAGPDGNMWFTEVSTSLIGRLNISTGHITEFPTPTASAYPHTIVAAADGNLWFTENAASQVARITPSGFITEFSTPTKIAHPLYMYPGPDGSLWFAEFFNNGLCRVDPIGLTFVEYTVPKTLGLHAVTTGLDGTVWATDDANDGVVVFGPSADRPGHKLMLRARSHVHPGSYTSFVQHD